MNKELVEYLKAYQEWRRGADTEQPDPTELGERLDEAIRVCQEAGFDVELLDTSKLKESREAHPLTTKEEAEKQVAEFDKVQPQTWAEEHKDMWATKAWREMRDVDAIVEERDKYKKALEDLKEWVKKEEKFHGVVGDSAHDFGKGHGLF